MEVIRTDIRDLISGLNWHERMKVLRAAKGWTQKEAANECGTNQKMYWLWENGQTFPRENSKKAIARAFEVGDEEIFGE
ncbi:MAG: Helix-turn-helix domain protein [Pelotomaculum sp. PtaB.Bin104]|nr:MAG: Helix-turn-helix domain protein [Pelotomaculum sp. PtaB.Bin104]